MFDFIKSTYKKGDKLKLTCVNGEFIGEILFISEDSIILKTDEGKTCGIKGCDISFFEEETTQSTLIPGEDTETNNLIPDTVDKIPSTESDRNEESPTESIVDQKIDTIASSTTEDEEENNQDKKPKLKIVGKIDIDAINQATRPRKAKIPKDKSKPTKTLKGLESLRSLLEDQHRRENEKQVPAIGKIKCAFPDRNFGFIIDAKSGTDLFFSFEQLIDSRIVSKSSGYLYELPVIYSIQNKEKGDIAVSIHRPGKVSELIKLAEELANEENIKHSVRVVEHILNEYPDNFTAYEFKKQLSKALFNVTSKAYSTNLYFKAKNFDMAKDYPNAIDYYLKAIEADIKLESSIKDLGSLYAKLFKDGGEDAEMYRQKAIQLMKDHEKDLPQSLSTLNYLEGFYYSIQYYDAFIEIAQQLLERDELISDKSRSSLLLCKIAVAYVQTDKIIQAIELLDEAQTLDPNNVRAIKLKSAIESNENKEDIIEAIISATQFDSLTSGLSTFIQQTLDEYNEYSGVPAKIKESGNFDETTLKGVRGIIDKFSGRSKERATYLLTEAKLMLDIEPENTLRLRTILARYCNDMAKTHIADNSSLDVIRFYYNEAFSLEESYDINARNVAYYILTHVCDYRELLQVTTRDITVDSALKKTIISDFDTKQWINILSMFLYNRVISAKLTSLFFSNNEYRNKAIQALNNLGISVNSNPSKEEFTDAWNNARETLKRFNSSVTASIRAITNSQSLEDMHQQLKSLNDLKKDWMCPLDINRIYTIINNIEPAISTYLRSSGYRNKEANRNNANGQIEQLIREIKKEPTKLSFEEFLPLLDSLGRLLQISFNEVVHMSEPRITIRLLSEQTVINDNGLVRIQIEVSNHKDSSPIKEVSISIDNRSDLKLISGGDVLYNAIEGGESHIFKLQFEASAEVIHQKATAVTIICNYRSGNETKQASSQLSLKLYSQDEFRLIENPYAPIADGGPVPLDSNMFFGRETEIENIVDAIIKSPSKQIIIYGQKRSGKSSVMLHLKQSLLNTGKTFCVFFSLGDIINNLSEASFYYKILSSIKQELEFLEIDGEKHVPEFEIPTAKVFKEEDEDNPLNTFTKYMIRFKLSCKQTDGWQNKNLVVMIDEFTYLYTEIKRGNISNSIMKQWKAITQNERAQFSVVLVGQDVVPSFKKEDYARNAFGVIQDIRLTYLKEEPARALIETPILDEDGKSRYIGDAVSKIIEYTSRNPYYIQIFCSRLVDFMNQNKSISVTEADVNEVANSFIDGSDALEEDKFDNLIRAGESEDLQEYKESDILAILRQIAVNSKIIGYCNRSDINALDDKEIEDAILKDLYDREVLEMRGENNYRIQVKLFQEWLLNH